MIGDTGPKGNQGPQGPQGVEVSNVAMRLGEGGIEEGALVGREREGGS